MKKQEVVGFFDSGLGGLTVLSAFRKHFPHESCVYLGDTARLPYGTKSPEVVRQYALECARVLMKKAHLKLLVVACNTASAHALETLERNLSIPVVGVIEAGVKQVLACPEVHSVAVLATAGTVAAGTYSKALKKQGFSGRIEELACPLFVPLVEEGMVLGSIVEDVARYYLNQLNNQVPDAVILGCTHYPMLLPVLRPLLDKATYWIDSGSSLPQYLVEEMGFEESSKVGAGELVFWVTDRPHAFQRLASLFLGEAVLESSIQRISIEEVLR